MSDTEIVNLQLFNEYNRIPTSNTSRIWKDWWRPTITSITSRTSQPTTTASTRTSQPTTTASTTSNIFNLLPSTISLNPASKYVRFNIDYSKRVVPTCSVIPIPTLIIDSDSDSTDSDEMVTCERCYRV